MDDIGQQSTAVLSWLHADLPAGAVGTAVKWNPETTVRRRLTECRQDFLRFFRKRLNRQEDAEDALQDFCVKVIRAADRLHDDEKVDAWLGRILRNTLTDHYRRRASWQRAEAAYSLEVRGAVFDGEAEQDDKESCIRHVLPMLRPDYAEILRRADLSQEPREQIAAELGLTANNVGVRLHRARRALRRKLEEVCPTFQDSDVHIS